MKEKEGGAPASGEFLPASVQTNKEAMVQAETMTTKTEPAADLRSEALRRLKKKRDFRGHLLAYVLVNALLWTFWGVGFVAAGVWFPWPLFAMFGWGIGLVFHAWDVYGRKPFSEEDIRREESRIQGR